MYKHMEGEVLVFIKGIFYSRAIRQCLDALLQLCKPSEYVLLRQILLIKQKPREGLRGFISLFYVVACGVEVGSKIKMETTVEGLNLTWRLHAGSIVDFESLMFLTSLQKKLASVGEPSMGGALMEMLSKLKFRRIPP